VTPAAVFVIALSLFWMGNTGRKHFTEVKLPERAKTVARWSARLASVNSYGLFANMTENRPEIVLEGSLDGVEWVEYAFSYKPGDLTGRPAIVPVGHMPRLDWHMWFAALRAQRRQRVPCSRRDPWLPRLMQRLIQRSPPVMDLLEADPLDGEAPRFVRARLYLYTFAEPGDAQGRWWTRQPRGMACPTIQQRRE